MGFYLVAIWYVCVYEAKPIGKDLETQGSARSSLLQILALLLASGVIVGNKFTSISTSFLIHKTEPTSQNHHKNKI